MAVDDLTPQLRTRLGRVERTVGWFVIIATVLMLVGLGYYIYQLAENKGWTKTKARYFTFVKTASGLKEGDIVRLMGFPAGYITKIEAQPASDRYFNVYVEFEIWEPYFGYVWTDSRVRVVADLFGGRYFDVSKGTNWNAVPIYHHDEKTFRLLTVLDRHNNAVPYHPTNKPPWVVSIESDAVNERLERVADQVEAALPHVLNLTNNLARVLSNTVSLTANLDATMTRLQPAVTNLTLISAQLTNGAGALGEWLIPTGLNAQLREVLASVNTTVRTADTTLQTAGATLTNANTNVVTLATSLNLTLLNLANITSNLNTQVQTNDQILSQISAAVVHADEMLQGLKRHWLLRSAFKEAKTNPPSVRRDRPLPARVGKGQ